MSESMTTMRISRDTWKIINDERKPGDTMEKALLRLIRRAKE